MFIGDRNIFFHETSSLKNSKITVTARQACAIESTAKINPTMKIYFFILCKNDSDEPVNYNDNMIKILLKYPNIIIRRLIMKEYIKNTPLENWWSNEIINKSQWPVSHMSDILRYLTLWKFGGIYLDLDIIMQS